MVYISVWCYSSHTLWTTIYLFDGFGRLVCSLPKGWWPARPDTIYPCDRNPYIPPTLVLIAKGSQYFYHQPLDSSNAVVVQVMAKYAYVTLVMCGESYVQAALVLAQSLRNVNTTADLVVMVTDEVLGDSHSCNLTLATIGAGVRFCWQGCNPSRCTKITKYDNLIETSNAFVRWSRYQKSEYAKMKLGAGSYFSKFRTLLRTPEFQQNEFA